MEIRVQYLTEREVAAMTGIAVQTLRNWRSCGGVNGKKIPWFKLGPEKRSSVRYLLSDVVAFMEAHRVRTD